MCLLGVVGLYRHLHTVGDKIFGLNVWGKQSQLSSNLLNMVSVYNNGFIHVSLDNSIGIDEPCDCDHDMWLWHRQPCLWDCKHGELAHEDVFWVMSQTEQDVAQQMVSACASSCHKPLCALSTEKLPGWLTIPEAGVLLNECQRRHSPPPCPLRQRLFHYRVCFMVSWTKAHHSPLMGWPGLCQQLNYAEDGEGDHTDSTVIAALLV